MRSLLVSLVAVTVSTTAFADVAEPAADGPWSPAPAPMPVPFTPTLSPPSMTPVIDVGAPRPAVTSNWYGWQILAADGAVWGLAIASQQPEIALGWLVTGTVTHLAHGNSGRALGSLALRGLAPIAGAYIGYELDTAGGCSGEFCGFGGFLVGGFAGLVTAEVVDTVYAREEVEDPYAPRARYAARPRFTPVFHARNGNVGLGVLGQF